MSWAERTRQGVERWFTARPTPDRPSWGERIAGWAFDFLARGIYRSLEIGEPGAIESIRGTIEAIKANPRIPQYQKDYLDSLLVAGNPFRMISGVILTVFSTIFALLGAAGPLGNIMAYDQELLWHSFRFDPYQLMVLMRRSPELYEVVKSHREDHGFEPGYLDQLKKLTEAYPTPRDVVGFLAHEVFEPDMIAKYGLLSEWDKIDKEFARKIGLEPDILELYWMDHWEHPEWGTIRELRHRDQITDEDVEAWFRIVEIPEYWRDKMLNVLWGLPNRIEIRMMARYLDMSKAEVMDLLKKAGLHEDYRSDAADFMIIMGLQGYWATLVRNGWLTADELKGEIEARGISPAIADRVYKRIVKNEVAERSAGERDLTKTDIIKGVKQERITRIEGVELLKDLGYDEAEAWFILDINIPPDQEDQVVEQRQLTKSDVIKGLKTEVITMTDARARLLELRYSPRDVEFLLNIYQAMIKPPVDPKLKEASKADVIQAVKKGLLTQEEAYLMLQDIDYSPEASEFILAVRTEESPFSPVSFEEFKERTGKWRTIMGREIPPEEIEIKNAANELIRVRAEVVHLRTAVEEEKEKLVSEEPLPEEATKRLKELQVTLHRAEAELTRVQNKYDAMVAEWKHKGK